MFLKISYELALLTKLFCQLNLKFLKTKLIFQSKVYFQSFIRIEFIEFDEFERNDVVAVDKERHANDFSLEVWRSLWTKPLHWNCSSSQFHFERFQTQLPKWRHIRGDVTFTTITTSKRRLKGCSQQRHFSRGIGWHEAPLYVKCMTEEGVIRFLRTFPIPKFWKNLFLKCQFRNQKCNFKVQLRTSSRENWIFISRTTLWHGKLSIHNLKRPYYSTIMGF